MNPGLSFLIERAPEIGEKTLQHVMLTGVSIALAMLIGIPLGIWIRRRRSARGSVLGGAGVLQTIPSVALLALLMIPLGIGMKPAIVALVLYALLPIIRNTFTGLEGVSPEVIEAARGLGFTERQQLWLVEIPLALPVMVAGIRTAAVITVGVATLSALIGAGGLGDFIFRGIALRNTPLIVLGCASSAILALLFDFGIGLVESRLRRGLRT